jgi:hypothetical protein
MMGDAASLGIKCARRPVPGKATGAAKALKAKEAESIAMIVPLNMMKDKSRAWVYVKRKMGVMRTETKVVGCKDCLPRSGGWISSVP